MPCTDELAAMVGQDKPIKDGAEAYDKAYGDYFWLGKEHQTKSTPLPHEPSPIKNVSKGK